MRHLLPAVVLLSSIACEPRLTACEEAALHAPELVVGTGEESFAALAEGDALPTVFGPQGGQHVPLAFRTVGIDPGARRFGEDTPGPRIAFLLTGDDVEVGWGETYQEPLRGDPAEAEILDQRLFLDWFEPSEHEAYVLSVDLEDSCGTQLSQELDVAL